MKSDPGAMKRDPGAMNTSLTLAISGTSIASGTVLRAAWLPVARHFP
jgi:hypothetical protein